MSESNSDSDSSQTQINESQDNRITGGTGSVNLVTSRSSVGGNVNISTTDFGSVGRSFDFAEAIAKGAANTAAASAAQVQAVATDAMKSVQAAYGDSNETLADAYKTSKAGEQKVMVAVGMAIVGVVALKALGRA
ncbi:hypothetical protein ACL9RI_25420 [Janthinobacterium sp. Mn2066]|uniref:hypothetical protein n=1 Tax=Janthinobacterium sp. Mn2066 TaxID=3395264 RepID=UPI003BBBBCB8